MRDFWRKEFPWAEILRHRFQGHSSFSLTKRPLSASYERVIAVKQMRALVYVVAGRINAVVEGEGQWWNERR
jgi:hypothetical protein